MTAIDGPRVRLDLAAPIKPGDGVVFDGSEAQGIAEQGGRVYDVRRTGRNAMPSPSLSAGPALLGFGHRDIDLRKLRIGQRVWKTDDPELTKRVRSTFEGPPQRLVDLDLTVTAIVGEPLRIEGTTATGYAAAVSAHASLSAAERIAATPDALRDQVDRLGGTIYRLRGFQAVIEGGPMVPKSLVNTLRRELIAALDASIPSSRSIASDPVLPVMRAAIPRGDEADGSPARLSALCRTVDQAEAAIGSGVSTIDLEFADIRGYTGAIARLRSLAPSVSIWLATPRIQKPREAPIFRFLSRVGADGLLVRNAGGIEYCARWRVPFVADFSLNASNELTVAWLMAKGARRVTASYDLSFDQLDDLVSAVPAGWIEVVIHQHMPMFHMEHCVFCAFLSPGTDKTNCGRPCDSHDVKLRDRVGMEHPLTADVGCRNTLYNAVPQTAAEYLPRLIERGVRHLRVEFLDDAPSEVATTLALYSAAISGRRDARGLWKDLKATNRYGVTRGQLAVL